MKTSETCVAQGELQSVAVTLEAPISLTPEQLEAIAAGLAFPSIPGHPTIFGVIIKGPFLPAPVHGKTTIIGFAPLNWS